MNYEETIHYLYNQYPLFQQQGASAYKPGLDRSIKLDKLFKNPHESYKTIHIGGTNGKGSTSHALAAILQKAGYKVGLYTSPHLVDFRERIRINGEMIDKNYIVNFLNKNKADFEPLSCSFFELTMMMAFCYFRDNNIDFGIIEVGLGGLLDSTNIISPIMSIITNISFDHTQFLGNTLESIAEQKAGIIKQNTPVIIGSATGSVKKIFIDYAHKKEASIQFANEYKNTTIKKNGNQLSVKSNEFGNFNYQLGGLAQTENIKTILSAISALKSIGVQNLSNQVIQFALSHITELTHLQGRWQIINKKNPLIICDTGHNIAGLRFIVQQLNQLKTKDLRLIIGFSNDKDISEILKILPQQAKYFFVAANINRSLPAKTLAIQAQDYGLTGDPYPNIQQAFNEAIKDSTLETCIFIGGSNFVVGEFLEHTISNPLSTEKANKPI